MQELLSGFTDALTHADRRVRVAAVMLFARVRSEPEDLDLLLPLFVEELELFEGVPEPWFGGEADRRSVLASAIASRAQPGHRAVDVLEREALEAGRAAWLIAGLVGLDPAWVRSHAAAILSASPAALDPLLFNLKLRGIDMRDFLVELRASVDDQVIRLAIRSAPGDAAVELEAAVFGA